MIRRAPFRLLAGPLATVLLLAASVEVLWNSFERSKEADRSVEQAYRILILSERFLSTLREAESSLRAYRITRRPTYAATYREAVNGQATILADLEDLTRDNSNLQARLKTIRALTAERLSVMAQALDAIDHSRFDILEQMTRNGAGGRIMNDLTAGLHEFQEDEHRLLALRTNAAAGAIGQTRFMLIFTSSLLAVALLLAGVVAERDVRNRAVAYEALQRQAGLIDFSHDAIVTLNPGGEITGWNAGAAEIYGWSSAEALGRPAREFLKAAEDNAAAIDKALSETGRWDGLLTHTTKTGVTRLVDSRYVQVRNRAGEPVGVLNISRDETQRRQAEELLRQIAEQRRLALDAAQLGSWDYDVASDRVLWDERCREILGLPGLGPASFEQVIKVVYPEERESMRAAAARALSNTAGGRFSQEMRILLKDGSVRWIATYGRVYFSEGAGAPRPLRVIGVNSDITGRKRVEQALREREQELAQTLLVSDRERRRLGAILETLPAGVVFAGPGDVLLDANAEALKVWRAGDFQTLAGCMHRLPGWSAASGEPIAPHQWPRARALHGETVLGEIIDIERFDGSKGTVFNSASPVRDAAGQVMGAVGVMVDITEQRQVELALRRSEERLRQAHDELARLLEQKNILFKEVQHRVKNNLQVVSSLLSLEAQRFEDRDFRNALNESRDRVRSMALMHEKFYHLDDLARIEFADYVEELARYFFSSYIAEPSAIAFSSRVDVRLSMDEAIPCGLILQELLSNSVKHAFPEGKGEIRVEFQQSNGVYRFCYRDNGIGLPPGVSLKNPETLGLQLVTDLASQLRGNIAYEYREGAAFTLTFG